MRRIDRRSLLLMLALISLVIVGALVRDVWIGSNFGSSDDFGPPFRRSGPDMPFQDWPAQTRGLINIVRVLAGITATVGVGLLGLVFVPRPIQQIVTVLQDRAGAAALLGIATVVGGTLLAGLALVSVLAIPFVPLILLALLSASAVGVLAVAVRLGQWLRTFVRGEPGVTADLLTGVLVLALGSEIPFVGRGLPMLAACWGLGAVILTRAGGDRPLDVSNGGR